MPAQEPADAGQHALPASHGAGGPVELEGSHDTQEALLLDQPETSGPRTGRFQRLWLLIPVALGLLGLASRATRARGGGSAAVGAAVQAAVGLSEQADSGGYPMLLHEAEEILLGVDEEAVQKGLILGPGLWTNQWRKPLHVHDEPVHPRKSLRAHGRRVDPEEWVVGASFGEQWIKLIGEPGYLPIAWGKTRYMSETPLAYVSLRPGSPSSCRDFDLEPVRHRAVCEAAGVALNRSNILYRELALSDNDTTANGGNVEMRCYSAGDNVMWSVLKSEVASGHYGLVCTNHSQRIWTTTARATTSTVPRTTPLHPTTKRATTKRATTTRATTTKPPPPPPQCDSCTPQMPQRPTVVIPFYERDLCKALILSKSISVMDKQRVLGDVNFMWISHHPKEEYAAQIEEIQAAARATHRVWLFDFHWLVGEKSLGWRVQQILKLKIASKMLSDYYLILDAKNAIISPIGPHTFFDECNRGVVWGKKAAFWHGLHESWYRKSAEVLGLDPPHDDEVWPASISPQLFHKQTVLDLLGKIGENVDPNQGLCNGNLCNLVEHGATEFTLYNVWVRRHTRSECLHAQKETGSDFDPSEALWRGDDVKKWAGWNLKNTQRVADQVSGGHNGTTIMFGAQAGAIDGMDADQHYAELQALSKIFQAQGLFDGRKSWQELAACIVGPPGSS